MTIRETKSSRARADALLRKRGLSAEQLAELSAALPAPVDDPPVRGAVPKPMPSKPARPRPGAKPGPKKTSPKPAPVREVFRERIVDTTGRVTP